MSNEKEYFDNLARKVGPLYFLIPPVSRDSESRAIKLFGVHKFGEYQAIYNANHPDAAMRNLRRY